MDRTNKTKAAYLNAYPSEKLIEELILEKRFSELRELVLPIPAADTAEIFECVAEKYRSALFRLLPKELAAEVFVEMSSDSQKALIESFTDTELSEVLCELYIDDTVDIIEEMPATVVKRIIRNSEKENRNQINKILRYPKNSAGSIMTTEYVRFTKEMTVEKALIHIRRVAIDKETIYTCYVTDAKRNLIGIVTAKELLLSAPQTRIEDIMEESVVFVNTGEDKEAVALKFKKYGFLALPVVDGERRLVGIITVDDAIDVIRDEAEVDFAKMAAITPTETTYLKTSAFTIWKSRIPWLLLLMISATFSSTILSRFEAALPAVLILFVPMLMDTGGNSGGQSSVTVIRAISVGEVGFSDILRVMWKEVRIGVYSGVTLGGVVFLKVILVDRLLMNNAEVTVTVALSVALSLALTIIAAKLIGSVLPIFAKKIGFDPAVMASPLITTLVDVISLLLYFFIASKVFIL